jgi:hypothetical protein
MPRPPAYVIPIVLIFRQGIQGSGRSLKAGHRALSS